MHIVHGMRVDFNLFRVFEAIYTNGGVSAAGEVLHLTQPAISLATRCSSGWARAWCRRPLRTS